ncbi:MAG: SlyX family protein [Planctomycetaceae bacterium]|nr:SlyX family protein [Planctomycetaceae bacterium]
MNSGASTEERLATIEVLLSHLQHDVDKLNDALISQQGTIDELRRSLVKLESQVDQMPFPAQDPLDERPPHY